MRVEIQWMTDPARDWETYDSSKWATLPKKADGAAVDGERGIIAQLAVEGFTFGEDHLHLEELPSGRVRITAWSVNMLPADNPDDPGLPRGIVVVIGEEEVTTRREYTNANGHHCTETSRGPFLEWTIFCDPSRHPELPTQHPGGEIVWRSWTDFVAAPEDGTRHGILVSDALWKTHRPPNFDCVGLI